jgi:isoquinoline 1-oxidoreductase alpha subunit
MSQPMAHTVHVNGARHTVTVQPEMPLLWVLREVLQLPGARFGCGMALCGTCTVWLDGVPSRACVLPIGRVGTRHVITIEGLQAPVHSPEVVRVTRAVEAAWTEGNVAQCGYCQSGQVMTAVALLRDKPAPSEADIDRAFDGVLCRCGTAPRVRAAVQAAALMASALAATQGSDVATPRTST